MTRRRTLGLAAGLAVVAVGVWWQSRPAPLDRLRADLDAADPGWRLADLRAARLADQPPAADNPVHTAAAARALVPAEFDAWVDADWRRTRDARRSVRPTLDPAGVPAWRAAAGAIAVARRAADQPRGVPDDPVPADPFQYPWIAFRLDAHKTLRLLDADAPFAASHGDGAGAVRSLRAALGIARALGREPFGTEWAAVVGLRVQTAEALGRTLAVAALPADGLAVLAADLRTAADPAGYAESVRDWRAVVDRQMAAVATGDVDLRGGMLVSHTRGTAPTRLGRLSYRLGAVDSDHVAALTYLTGLLEVARRPPHEWAAGVAALTRPPDDFRHQYAHNIARFSHQPLGIWQRGLATLAAASLAAECEGFRLARGRWPDALADLPPADRPDPYTGRPLLLKRLSDGLVAYSAGADARDDGGRLGNPLYVGPAPGTDIGVRLWDVAVRPRPAETPK